MPEKVMQRCPVVGENANIRLTRQLPAILKTGALIAICLLIFFSPYNKTITKVCLYSSIFLWICANLIEYKRGFYRKLIPATPINRPIILFLCAAAISILISPQLKQGLQIFFERYLLYFFVFWVTYGITKNTKRGLQYIAIAVTLLGIFIGIGALTDYVLYKPERLFTIFSIPVDLAFPLTFCIPFSFAVFAGKTQKRLKYSALAAFTLLLPALFFHGSRGALIAICLSILIIFLHMRLKYKGILIVLIAVSVIFMPRSYKERIGTITDMLNQSSVIERINLFNSAFEITHKYPFFGAGVGMYQQLNHSKIHLHAHNMYLEIAAEMGLIGLITFLMIMVVFLRQFVKIYKNWFSSGRQTGNIQIAAGLGVIAMLIFNCSVSSILVGSQDALVFWSLLAVGLNNSAITDIKRGENLEP